VAYGTKQLLNDMACRNRARHSLLPGPGLPVCAT